ncbi:MAG: hypothetical protein SWY16_01415 [Cyanobacteriota bacterium]|nr:hypothetical protein [Cyanobacteriota bacterium]
MTFVRKPDLARRLQLPDRLLDIRGDSPDGFKSQSYRLEMKNELDRLFFS